MRLLEQFAAKRIGGLAILGLVIGMATGCMTAPYHLQLMPSKDHSFPAYGYVLGPGQTVQVQYFNYSTYSWQTLKTTTSSSTGYNWSGEQWFPWTAGQIVVPSNGWIYATEFTKTARLRAVSGNSTLFTFDQEFTDCWEPNGSLEDLWSSCGHGNEVTVQALH